MGNTERKPSHVTPRTAAQQIALERRNRHTVVARQKQCPPRTDIGWGKPGAPHPRPDLSTKQLLEAVLWTHTRRGVQLTAGDNDTRLELVARTWGKTQLIGQACDHVPRWLSAMLPGRFRNRATFVAAVVAAHKAGAVGVLASQAELAAVYDVQTTTIFRWVRDLEADGLLEVIQTWQGRPEGASTRYPRGRWKLLYRPGPKLRAEVGLGLLEGAKGLSPAVANMARRCARVARAKVRKAQRAKADELWQLANARRLAAKGAAKSPPLRSCTKPQPSPLSGGRGIEPPGSPGGKGSRRSGLTPVTPPGAASAPPQLAPATPLPTTPPRSRKATRPSKTRAAPTPHVIQLGSSARTPTTPDPGPATHQVAPGRTTDPPSSSSSSSSSSGRRPRDAVTDLLAGYVDELAARAPPDRRRRR